MGGLAGRGATNSHSGGEALHGFAIYNVEDVRRFPGHALVHDARASRLRNHSAGRIVLLQWTRVLFIQSSELLDGTTTAYARWADFVS
jgi:hypothetical protein